MSFFGKRRANGSATGKTRYPTVADVYGYVKRARLGDQNASANLQIIEGAAKRGDAQSIVLQREALKYIAANPPETVDVGAETGGALSTLATPVALDPDALLAVLCFLPHSGDSGALESAVVLLSQGPEVSTSLIGSVQAAVPDAYKTAFQEGAAHAGEDSELGRAAASFGADPQAAGYLCAGHCLGLARRIQQVRVGAPFDTLSADVGWELDPPAPNRFNK